MTERTQTLTDRLAELAISVAECAAVCRQPVAVVTDWIENGPDAAGRVLLRWLDDEHVAVLAVAKIRNTVTRDLRGDGAKKAGIEGVPYGGGFTGTDAGNWT